MKTALLAALLIGTAFQEQDVVDKPEGDDALTLRHVRRMAEDRGMKINSFRLISKGSYHLVLFLSEDRSVEMSVSIPTSEPSKREILALHGAMKAFLERVPSDCRDREGEWWVAATEAEMKLRCPK